MNPFPDLILTRDDRTELVEIGNSLVITKFKEYQEYLGNQKAVDMSRWKTCMKIGNTTTFLDRNKSNQGSKMPASLMVGPLPGTLNDNMFGLVNPTLESMRIKSSYLKDFSAAAMLATIVEPTDEEPFRSVVIKWMEIDIPMASIATHMDTEEVARMIFVHKRHVMSNVFSSTDRTPVRLNMAGGSRFTVNPFPDLVLTPEDREQLVEIGNSLVLAKFKEYQDHLNNQKYVDMARWKTFMRIGNTTTYLERKKSNPNSKLPASLMVGPLPGTLNDNMFGLVNPTLESMRIKSSYLKDFSAAAVLATIVEPTEEEPFCAVVVKWMEIDIPMSSIGIVRNRDYVYMESTGILRLENGERVGYHLLHSVSFPQTHELPNRIRGNMSFCGMFHQEGLDKTDCRGTGIMDPRGDLIRGMAIMGMVNATMAGLKYSYCGQMKKLAWLLEQKHAEARESGMPAYKPTCVTCSKEVKDRKLGEFGRPNSTCKLCFGAVCPSCKIPKKLNFVAPDLEMVQRKVSFCARCLLEATNMDTEEAARVQFVHKKHVTSTIYGSAGRHSNETIHSDSTVST
ncbi:hypothetical protein BBO99_00007588 [Phytophthora kernoviae]|uniref:FYVE-type domain-containing protein n=2 Tax=Phytophthora kernoviae TaxID=325452 RepID=A0A3R7J8F8_9STRA|nr:hypothetical protein G195_008510 [Phytophthora kernoviae 00238/432]KAG2508248.1 hypothetical protein JM16_008854 [Phytophthora kernoviae]RLN20389.1 hypothetical protein BBI17_008990 [Phytophthora kernoviae]RLN76389.1 hypothetical protein BBO99_00007588 [Phytophthora kernoviae]